MGEGAGRGESSRLFRGRGWRISPFFKSAPRLAFWDHFGTVFGSPKGTYYPWAHDRDGNVDFPCSLLQIFLAIIGDTDAVNLKFFDLINKNWSDQCTARGGVEPPTWSWSDQCTALIRSMHCTWRLWRWVAEPLFFKGAPRLAVWDHFGRVLRKNHMEL